MAAEASILILASASPRRQELLQSAGVEFEVIPADVDETMLPGEKPEEMVRRLAVAKAENVSRDFPNRFVLGADTVVVLPSGNGSGPLVLGKPRDAADARHMLELIQNRTHLVYTAFALTRTSPAYQKAMVCDSVVIFRAVTADEIEEYVATGEPLDKAGAYAVQGIGAKFIVGIQGSMTNVIGLPLTEVVAALKECRLWNLQD